MTRTSERERAEQELIDAAISFSDAPFYSNPAPLEARLRNAIEAYKALGIAQLAQRGATSNNSTDTSAQAAASLGDVSGLARICFDEIVLAGGLTVYQLTQVLGREHQTVSARANDLMRKGWIVDSGIRRKTGSGRNAVVWKPSHAALRTVVP